MSDGLSNEEIVKLQKFLDRTNKLGYYGAIPNLWLKPQGENKFVIDSYTYSDKVCQPLANTLRPILFTNNNDDDLNLQYHILPALRNSKRVSKYKVDLLEEGFRYWKTFSEVRSTVLDNTRLSLNDEVEFELHMNGVKMREAKVRLMKLKSDFSYANLYLNSEQWHANTKGWNLLSPFEKSLTTRIMFHLLASGHGLVLSVRKLVEQALRAKPTSAASPERSNSPQKTDSVSSVLESGSHFSYAVKIPFSVLEVHQWISEKPRINSSKASSFLLRVGFQNGEDTYKDLMLNLNRGYLTRDKNGLWLKPQRGHLITLFDPLTLTDGRYKDVSILF